MFLSGIMMFCELQDAAIQLLYQQREQHISEQDKEISVVEEIHISRLESQRWSLEFVISFSKVYIWDLTLRFGYFFLESCNSNLNWKDEFSVIYFLNYEKLKSFLKKLYPYNQIPIFRGTVMYVKCEFLYRI
jgi:hypothetical protein